MRRPAPHRIDSQRGRPLHGAASSRAIEQAAASALPAHTLMRRAGLGIARLALAVAPHARVYRVLAGPGNNGDDGFKAAMHLRRWGHTVQVCLLGEPEHAPADARASFERAQGAGVPFMTSLPSDVHADDLLIDALLGLGTARAIEGKMASWVQALQSGPAPVLAVDLPTGLNIDTGTPGAGPCVHARHTLSLLSLKPGLFTAGGRDAAGEIWFDDLGVDLDVRAPDAWLNGPPLARGRHHASHKGTHGDVSVLGGEGPEHRGMGMGGAALLAGVAALHAGAGRVMVAALDRSAPGWDAGQPDLMFRHPQALPLENSTVVCGCGGGDLIRDHLPRALSRASRLVLDADGLNAVSTDSALADLLAARGRAGRPTVLTPHPLEAGRMLGCAADQIQSDRLTAARTLSERYRATVVLKGSGTVIASPGELLTINPTGNGRLGTAGTGDVLAGLLGARMAGGMTAHSAACAAAWEHGRCADTWPEGLALTASRLARRLQP